jgi:hypothetical protein
VVGAHRGLGPERGRRAAVAPAGERLVGGGAVEPEADSVSSAGVAVAAVLDARGKGDVGGQSVAEADDEGEGEGALRGGEGAGVSALRRVWQEGGGRGAARGVCWS